jgi:hypothetical protein
LLESAQDLLPDGLFVAEKGPFWIEQAAGELSFLGATDRLFVDEEGSAVTRSAHLPVQLRRTGAGIAGEIGHVSRTFAPVANDTALGRNWEGEWVCDLHGARFRIVRSDGCARLTIGAGPLHTTLQLMPLDSHRALTDRREGPWRQRACLVLNPRTHTLRVVTNRSRILQFRKA